MEFHEKLQELRKARGLTQEELADALFVSRTAVSKWESGRGYPSIDSLKELSRFFSVTIDQLICPEEILSAAEHEKKAFAAKYVSLICGALDILPILLLLIPVFRNAAEPAAAVALPGITGMTPWVKAVLLAIVGLSVLNGICAVIVSGLDKPVWNRHRLVTGMVLSVVSTAVFLLTRQSYAGILCFTVLVIKGLLLVKAK